MARSTSPFAVPAKKCSICDGDLQPVRYGPYGAIRRQPGLPDDVLFVTLGGETAKTDASLWTCASCDHSLGRLGDPDDVAEYQEHLNRTRDALDARAFAKELVPQAVAEQSTEVRWEPPWIFFTVAGNELLMAPYPRLNEDRIFRFFGSAPAQSKHTIDGIDFTPTVNSESQQKCLSLRITRSSIVDGLSLPRRERYPCCTSCGSPLRTAVAKQCFECGLDWH